MAEELSNTLKVIALMVAFAGLMAAVCFGLCVLLMNVVDRLWPSKSFSKVERIASEPASATRVIQTEFNVEEFCQHLKTMAETELLKFWTSGEIYVLPPLKRITARQEKFLLSSLGNQERNGAGGTRYRRWTSRSNSLKKMLSSFCFTNNTATK
jgi:hypothetical protein